MPATIGVWSPTVQEVQLHSVVDSLLVRMHVISLFNETTVLLLFNACLFHSVPKLVELVSELQDVIDWRTFGLHLGIRMPKLESIKADYQTLAERRTEMLNEWQKNVTPTWSAVVQALPAIEMRQLASDLAQKHGS